MTDGTDNLKRLRALGNRRGAADQMEVRLHHDEVGMRAAIAGYEKEHLAAVPGAAATGADLKPIFHGVRKHDRIPN